jgi:hypothetical protein
MNETKTTAPVPSLEMLRQKIQGCQRSCAAVALEMNETATVFKATFRMPCPVYLSVQKLGTGSMYLRWRQTGVKRKQPYIRMEGKTGLLILQTMTPKVRQAYYRFHHQALYHNIQHALLLAELRRWEYYLQQRQALEQLKNQFRDEGNDG